MVSFPDYHHYLLQESIFGFVYRRFLLYPLLRLISGRSFLDVGCGKGLFLSYGDKRTCLGLDVNPFNVNYVSNKGLRANLIHPCGTFPVDSLSFPVCVLDQVLEHVSEPDIILSEISRCLKPGGKLIIGLPCAKGYSSDPDHKVFYTVSSLAQLMRTHPFRRQYFFYFPLPVAVFGKYFSFQYLYCVYTKT